MIYRYLYFLVVCIILNDFSYGESLKMDESRSSNEKATLAAQYESKLLKIENEYVHVKWGEQVLIFSEWANVDPEGALNFMLKGNIRLSTWDICWFQSIVFCRWLENDIKSAAEGFEKYGIKKHLLNRSAFLRQYY